jgi:hypothetical protein
MDMIRKDASVDGRFFVCPTMNEMVLRNRRIGIGRIDRTDYHSLHEPQAIARFEGALSHA